VLVFPPSAAEGITPKRAPAAGTYTKKAVETKVALPERVIEGAAETFAVPVTTTRLDAEEKLVAFQGDFTFDSSVVNFETPAVARAGLTAVGNWSLMANVLGKGKIKTLRVSCLGLDGQAVLAGEGVLFELRMRRVSGKSGASTSLNWSAAPDNFIFIDENLQSRPPVSARHGKITLVRTHAPK
jgi:hypothetical protein